MRSEEQKPTAPEEAERTRTLNTFNQSDPDRAFDITRAVIEFNVSDHKLAIGEQFMITVLFSYVQYRTRNIPSVKLNLQSLRWFFGVKK